MKTLTMLTICALSAMGLNASAQIQKGNVLVGGNLANLNVGLDNPKIFSIDISPKAGWFVRDNTALGMYANIGLETAKGSSTTVSYGLGALARKYAGSDTELLRHGRLFGEATLGIGGVNVSDGGGNTNGLNFSAGPGFAYFVTRNIGLEALLKYNGLAGFGNEGSQSNINLSFGLQIYLPGRSTANKIKGDAK